MSGRCALQGAADEQRAGCTTRPPSSVRRRRTSSSGTPRSAWARRSRARTAVGRCSRRLGVTTTVSTKWSRARRPTGSSHDDRARGRLGYWLSRRRASRALRRATGRGGRRWRRDDHVALVGCRRRWKRWQPSRRARWPRQRLPSVPRTRGTLRQVKRRDVIARIGRLLDAEDDRTVGTSMRIPEVLRDAAALAVEHLHVAQSTTALTVDVLRSRLESIVLQAALDSHYRQNPSARPSLGDLAVAAAELDGHPLASHPDVLRRAAIEVEQRHPEADADDVLLWAEAQAAVTG